MSKYAIVIPVYNRPNEVEDLLASLVEQTFKNFSIYIVEDGSSLPCKSIVDRCEHSLLINYFYKDNSGPGTSRNYGVEKSKEDYIVFFDSDCIIPPDYFQIVDAFLTKNPLDAYGGPDSAREDFSTFQKAINYSMTSFFTTGGIRGGSEASEKFQPRSFNMGISREVYKRTKGFSKMRFGEDVDLSLRIAKEGFKTGLIKDAFVYHNRRSNLKQFFKQVYNSGIARINLHKLHPGSLKLVHSLPSVFTLGVVTLLLMSFLFSKSWLIPIGIHAGLILIDASIRNRNLAVGLWSVVASYVQLIGYGLGFIVAFWKRIILKQSIFTAFEDSFYD